MFQVTNEWGLSYPGRRMSDLSYATFPPGGSTIVGDLKLDGRLLLWSNGTWWSRDKFDSILGSSTEELAARWRFRGGLGRIRKQGQDLNVPLVAGSKFDLWNEQNSYSAGTVVDPYTLDVTGHRVRGRLIERGSYILWNNGTWWGLY